jgi:hypothetical protein
MHQFWRLSEYTDDNLGVACTSDGLMLGHTPLIERRDGCFVVRDSKHLERLLRRAFRTEPPIDRLMSGLTTVAAALNADDQCLARIAAVHLRIPNLSNRNARSEIEAEDHLIRYANEDWDPAKHPRTGTPDYEGGILLNTEVRSENITGRTLNLVVPKGAMTATQRDAIEAARAKAMATNGYPVAIIITAF